MIEITINPGQKKFTMPVGTLILDVLKLEHIIIPTPCGGKGNCGKCKVLVFPQDSTPNKNEQNWLTEEEIKKGFRLACQTYLSQDTTITVPAYAPGSEEVPIINGKIKFHLLNDDFQPIPPIKKIYLKLMPPTLQDQRSDWSRIKSELENQSQGNYHRWKIPIDILARIPSLLRGNDFQITLVLFKDTVISVEAGDTRNEVYGIAFDIGTTTIAGYLLNLSTFEEIAIGASDNPQCRYGDDVISRIDFSGQDSRGKDKLQKELINTLNQMIFSFAQKSGIDHQKIYLAVLVGNTCMHHFFWRLPTENLATSPYIPVTTDSILKESLDLPNFCLPSHAKVYTAPNISAYVGGDIIADMIDISIWRKAGGTLIVDLGTNGEIILTAGGKIWACSAAAGPAFEGARINSGMRATYGAVDKVKITKGKLDYHVIGQCKAIGICGSGIVDLIAELIKLQIIQPNGRLIKREECPDNVANAIKERIIQEKEYTQFLIIPGQESASANPIFLTQKDIREIQLAKGAVAAGIRILLEKAEIEPEDIEEIMLAGAFGNVLNTESALKIGIIPHTSNRSVRSIGNAAGQGAEKLLLSEEMRDMADRLSKKVQYIELSSHHDFQNIFADSLFFRDVL
jgi:uncharacterized 2Fe-2S/4Fe-4S cluster protein (DUF4445 family)